MKQDFEDFKTMIDIFEQLSTEEQDWWVERASDVVDGLYWCARSWESWGTGTMSPDDFIEASGDIDLTNEIAARMYAAFLQWTERTKI